MPSGITPSLPGVAGGAVQLSRVSLPDRCAEDCVSPGGIPCGARPPSLLSISGSAAAVSCASPPGCAKDCASLGGMPFATAPPSSLGIAGGAAAASCASPADRCAEYCASPPSAKWDRSAPFAFRSTVRNGHRRRLQMFLVFRSFLYKNQLHFD